MDAPVPHHALMTAAPLPPSVLPATRAAFRDAMAATPAGVHVVTTDGPHGRAGFTATAVCSVSDEPPTVLVCLNRSSSAYAAFRDHDAVCINLLGEASAALAQAFGGRTPMEERFAAARWQTLVSGAPALEGARVVLDGRIVQRLSVATHDVLICEVLAIVPGPEQPGVVYHARRFTPLPTA